ncbi:RNA-binding protein PIN4, partial [Zancudomyces culisetae]
MLKATGSEEKAVVGETKNEVDIGNRVEVSEEQSREEAKAKNRREALAALTADKGAVGSDREEQREREKVGRTNRRNTIMTMRGYYGKAGNVGGTNGASGMGRGMGMGMSMGMGMGMGVGGGRRPEDLSGEALELMANRPADVIPNAIVVKNINFAVSRAEFLSIMTSLGLPLPYAFDYHYENGNFKGLAFGNFRSNEDTARVIVTMDGYKLLGRAIKVEYKKTLPMHDDDAQHNKESRERGAADLRGIGDMGIRKQHAMMDEGVMGRGRPPMGFGGDEEYQPGNLEFDENDLLRFVDFREKDPKLLYNVINHFRSDNSVSEMELPPAL